MGFNRDKYIKEVVDDLSNQLDNPNDFTAAELKNKQAALEYIIKAHPNLNRGEAIIVADSNTAKKYWSGNAITKLKKDYVFVFGSNPEGRHGWGAANHALKFGAVYYKGRGHYGQTYALVTKNLKAGFTETLPSGLKITYKDAGVRSLTPSQIRMNIEEFYRYAEHNPELKFFVAYRLDDKTLNGYRSIDIINMFTVEMVVPANVYFHTTFRTYKKELGNVNTY